MINRYERLNQELKMVETKRKVAAYCRVSTDNEDQANSFESQQRYFRQYIERNPDWELYEIFADEGISGTNTKKRKEFNRMIACAKNGDFDLIITKEISRFARNTLDSIYYTRELKKHGVGVIFMNDNINTLDGDAELRLAIMSSIAQEESRKTSERVKWGQKRQMEQGVVFGRSMLGYDVEGGKMTINEEGAKVVRLIFHKFVNEGKGTHVIARELREEGISPMRVKEWSNTVILRVIRNEKYCGDLVQKKTYTPDFLSHEKKYNRGQEEFVIIKDHHEPIISRELFDEANRILDAKSLSQEGKAKHSNRYPFSGKIKCGCCGSSYVARYKTRKDGSRYKAWRCNEAAKHGSPHIDKAGNQVGCTGLSIRNEDATHIMYLVTKSLKYNRDKIINNLTAVIQSIIAMDTTGTDVLKLQEQIKKIEGKRANLIDLYMSNLINKDEFTATRASCDAEIEELQSIIESVDKQREMIEQQQQLLKEIEDAIKEIVSGVEYEDEFYKHILDKMVVQDKDNIDVYLNLLPMKWSYTVAKASKKAVASEWNISEASLPISVSVPIRRRSGMEYRCERYLVAAPISPSGPPSCDMIMPASFAFGRLTFTGYSSLFSYIHMLICPHFPRPRRAYPVPAVACVCILCERTAVFLIFSYRSVISLSGFVKIFKRVTAGAVSIKIESCLGEGKARLLDVSHKISVIHFCSSRMVKRAGLALYKACLPKGRSYRRRYLRKTDAVRIPSRANTRVFLLLPYCRRTAFLPQAASADGCSADNFFSRSF